MMSLRMNEVKKQLETQIRRGNLLATSVENVLFLLANALNPVVETSIKELIAENAWEEINDRFYKKLSFGTGGMRGRTIGNYVTTAEKGKLGAYQRPEHPCVGTNCLNEFNITRAITGLVECLKKSLDKEKVTLVVAHDTRFFSEEFTQLCAKIVTNLGSDIYLFKGARSTPQLSFAVRELSADGGVVLTASHNPPHDNGFKVYFKDGGQLVEPHVSQLIEQINQVKKEAFVTLNDKGKAIYLDEKFDEKYRSWLRHLLLRPSLFESEAFSVVYTNLHGTGGKIIVPLLKNLGIKVKTVAEQNVEDSRFPTVKSPNPENQEALSQAIKLADSLNIGLVIGTDPDADRMGVAVKNKAGDLVLLSGNQIGSLLAWYRLQTLFDQNILNNDNAKNAVIIKTLVTTPLQNKIANDFGVHLVETLTGFKYIGAKLKKYQAALPKEKAENYQSLAESESRELYLKFSKYFVFGGEESYGYLGADFVRDKDANGSALMMVELALFARSRGLFMTELLDQLYQKYGLHLERSESLVMRGAKGNEKIKQLIASYQKNPPQKIAGRRVVQVRDFSKGDEVDIEGEVLPAESMFMFDLSDDSKIAVRPSGTEPKIKYYLFVNQEINRFSLEETKRELEKHLDNLWECLHNDVLSRMS